MLNLAADLDLVVSAQKVVDVRGVGAVDLLAAPRQEPIAATTGHPQGDGVFDPGSRAVVGHAPVVAELTGAHFEETAASHRAVVLDLPDPGWRILDEGRILGDVLRVAHIGVGTERLVLDSVLQVGDELVLRGHLVRHLARVVDELGCELGAVENRAGSRLIDDVLLVQVTAPGPQLVLDDRAAHAGVEVAVVEESVGVRAIQTEGLDNCLWKVRIAAGELIGGQVPALNVLVLVLVVELAGELVAARLPDEVRDDAAARHLGGVARRAHHDLVKRAVVEVETGRRRAFGGVDALDQGTVLAAVTVGDIGGLRAGRAAAHIEAAQGDPGCGREERPHIAGVREGIELSLVEVRLRAGGSDVDGRSLAGDRDLVGEGLDAHLHRNLGGEADADADVVLGGGSETGEFELEGVGAGGQSGEPEDALPVGGVGAGAHHGRAADRNGYAGKNAAALICDFALDTAGGTRATLCEHRRGAGHDQKQQCCQPTIFQLKTLLEVSPTHFH